MDRPRVRHETNIRKQMECEHEFQSTAVVDYVKCYKCGYAKKKIKAKESL